MKQYPNPSATKRGWLELTKGLDLVNSIALVHPQAMTKAENVVYKKGTITRRPAFREYVAQTEWTGLITGANSYIDDTGTERILFSTSEGDLEEIQSDFTTETRATGFNINRVRFQNMLGACFAIDGGTPWRGDADTWREAGAPPSISNLSAAMAGSGAGTSLVGSYYYIVVPVIEDTGIAILKGDWSNIAEVDITIAGRNVTLSWDDVSDSRVTHYYIYRTQRDLGDPFYYEAKVLAGVETYASTATDSTLTEQLSDPAGRNGIAPSASLVTQCGQRLVLAKLSDGSSDVHLSTVSTNNYEMEYFPIDGIHRFKLPGNGPVTAIKGIGVKDEDSNRNDLFLAQKDSCYILRSTDPNSTLETISGNVGCINPDAVVQWGGYLFFMSKRGVEFLGPTGKPLVISDMVKPILFGGGPQNFSGITGFEYVAMEVYDNKLIVTFRQSSSNDTQDTALVLDLEAFDPITDPVNTSRWTVLNGLGFSFFVETKDRNLLLFDNINNQILKAEPPTSVIGNDSVSGVDTPIVCQIWTGSQLGFNLDSLKQLRRINAFIVSDSVTMLEIESNYSEIIESINLIPESTSIEWDFIWDVVWSAGDAFICSEPVGRNALGRFFQLKFTHQEASSGFILLGYSLYYSEQKNIILKRR